MKIKSRCLGCGNFMPARMIGSGDGGEWVYPECRLGYSVDANNNQECNQMEVKDYGKKENRLDNR